MTPTVATGCAERGDRIDELADAVRRERRRLGASDDLGGCIDSELSSVDRVLARIQREGLTRGPVFCEWGSGLGGGCGAAALNGFQPIGIEIHGALVRAARSIADRLGLSTAFAEGTFLLPGDEDLGSFAHEMTTRRFDRSAWGEAGLAPVDCDVVFAYPWPGEEDFVDRVFARHAGADSLLMTFHDFDHVFVQRKNLDELALEPVGWL